VTLDAIIMDDKGGVGAVAALEDIVHAISVARLVMEKTPHTLLVGEGATRFALDQGMKRTKLLTPEAEKAWRDWLKSAQYQPSPIARTSCPRRRDRGSTTTRSASWRADSTGGWRLPAPRPAWPSRCAGAWATRRRRGAACSSKGASAPPPRPASARK